MSKRRISIISAICESNRGIGKANTLLWDIKSDMAHFKRLTTGHVVIMGERTYHSMGRALPNRINIVITDNRSFEAPNVLVTYSLEEALEVGKLHEQEEVFIIGGGSIYTQMLPFTDRLYLTLVDGEYDADTFFPAYDEFTKVIEEERGSEGEYTFRFVTLEKN
jgi:dihydrofolate reductase